MLTKKEISTLIGISLMTFIIFLDVTIVSTALPAIQHEFVANIGQLQWILNALFLALSALMATIGRIGDLLGRRRVLTVAACTFLIASIGAGSSPSIEWLIFFRFLQGIAGASIPVAAALLSNHFPTNRQPHILALFATINGTGLAIGPLVGGVLVETLGWRWIFFINIPIILISLALCAYSVSEQKSNDPDEKIDILAALAMVIGISTLVVALSEAPNWGWDNLGDMTLFAVAIVSLVAFCFINHRSKHPIVGFDVFRNRYVFTAALCCFSLGGIVGVLLFLNPIYLQSMRGESAEYAGLVLLGISGTFIAVAPFTGKFTHCVGIKWSMYATLLLSVLTCILHQQFTLTSPLWITLLAFVTLGLPWSLSNVAPTLAVVSAIDSKHTAVTLGSIWTIWNLGSCVMLAMSGFLLRYRGEAELAKSLREQNIAISPDQLDSVGHLIADPDNAKQLLSHFSQLNVDTIAPILKDAFMQGYSLTLQALIVISVFLAALGYFILRRAKEVKIVEDHSGEF